MLYSTKEIAIKYKFSQSQIRRLIREGRIPAKKVGLFWIIDDKDLKQLERRRKLKSV